jgi:hypothetical protein
LSCSWLLTLPGLLLLLLLLLPPVLCILQVA